MKLSDGAAQESDFCMVVAVGEWTKILKVGDVVLRPAPANYEWTDEDDGNQLYLITKEQDVAARVRHGG